MFLFCMPMGYGWGYRGWGLRTPATSSGGAAPSCSRVNGFLVRPPGVGLGGDFVWLMLIVVVAWSFWGCSPRG